jgi:hypothetical protein
MSPTLADKESVACHQFFISSVTYSGLWGRAVSVDKNYIRSQLRFLVRFPRKRSVTDCVK